MVTWVGWVFSSLCYVAINVRMSISLDLCFSVFVSFLNIFTVELKEKVVLTYDLCWLHLCFNFPCLLLNSMATFLEEPLSDFLSVTSSILWVETPGFLLVTSQKDPTPTIFDNDDWFREKETHSISLGIKPSK